MNVNYVKNIVENNLTGNSLNKVKARSDDNWLIINTLIEMGFAKKINNKIIINCDLVNSMPSFESITRCRRKLNEENKCLPPENIRLKREKAQVEYRKNYNKRTECCLKESYLSW